MNRAAVALLLCWAWTAAAAPIQVIDDVGRTVTIPAPATRIISLAPHLTEILFELGVGDAIVATVRFSDYPEAAKHLPQLGDAFSVNVEAVMALRPDLVLAWRSGGADRALEQLEALGVTLYFNEAVQLRDIGASMRKIAELVGRPALGVELSDAFVQTLDRLEANAPHQRIRVFFQIADENIYTVNRSHLIGQAISLCGGDNPFGDIGAPVPMIGQEAVLAANPDLIVITRVPEAPRPLWMDRWEAYPGLAGKVRPIDPDLISRPGPRMRTGIQTLCGLIQDAAVR